MISGELLSVRLPKRMVPICVKLPTGSANPRRTSSPHAITVVLTAPKPTSRIPRLPVAGAASAKVAWRGQNPKLENAEGEAFFRLDDGRVVRLPILEKLAGLTGEKEFERLTLNECAAEVA